MNSGNGRESGLEMELALTIRGHHASILREREMGFVNGFVAVPLRHQLASIISSYIFYSLLSGGF